MLFPEENFWTRSFALSTFPSSSILSLTKSIILLLLRRVRLVKDPTLAFLIFCLALREDCKEKTVQREWDYSGSVCHWLDCDVVQWDVRLDTYWCGHLGWLLVSLSLGHSEGEVGAEAEAGAGRARRDLPRVGVHPPHSPGGGHAGVLRLGGEHVLCLVPQLSVQGGTGLAVTARPGQTQGGVRGAAGELREGEMSITTDRRAGSVSCCVKTRQQTTTLGSVV